ncbi:MAG: efflux RND transporter permease subunit [Proteobacteria bacterium]|nr:efflux RND transporter permease subunit [Pseudomonadota bacterium]
MNRIISYFIHRHLLVNIITLMVIGGGVFAALSIQREFFPHIEFDVVVVSTSFPGASSETVEKLITNPLERAVLEVEGIKKLSSVSAEGFSSLELELDPDVTNVKDAKSAVQDVVDSWTKLPSGAKAPRVLAPNTGFMPVITVVLTGDVDEGVLRQAARSLERPLEALSDVAKVDFQGMRDYEIFVEASKARLEKWDVSLLELVGALRANNLNIPAGSQWQSEKQQEVIIRTLSELNGVEDIQNTVVRANSFGEPVYVKDVADVKKGFQRRTNVIRTNGQSAHHVTVFKKKTGDIITLVDDVKALMASDKIMLPQGVSYDFLDDRSYFVKRRLGVLSNNLLVGLILVVLILSFALPWRVALIAAFGIPFALFAALMGMYYLGVTVNVISMLGLILVIGMLVDDAIVVTENIQRHIESGLPPSQAAIKGTSEIWPPLLASVSTTMIAFAPLMFFGDVSGKFFKVIPIGVLLGLAASLLECFFILPNHMAHWVKKKKDVTEGVKQQLNFWHRVVVRLYGFILHWVVKLRYITVPLVLVALVATIVLNKSYLRQFKLFPGGTVAQFSVRLEGVVGQPLAKTSEMIKVVEEAVAALPGEELQNYRTTIGRFQQGQRRGVSGSQYAQTTVYLTEDTERERSTDDIIAALKQSIGKIEGASYNIVKARSGPPGGSPVAIGIRGQDYTEIMAAAAEVKALLLEEKGVSDVVDSFRPGKTEVHVVVDPKLAAASGLSLNDIGQTVRASYDGVVASSIEMLSEEIDIRVRLVDSERDPSKSLASLLIPNQRGQKIPISKVARFSDKASMAAYEHESNQRQVVVSAEMNYRENSPIAVSASMEEKIKPLREKYASLSFVFGGESQETEESGQRLKMVALTAFTGIFLLLILLFSNIFQPIIISLTIPVAIIPLIWVFKFHGMPLSFLAVVGMVALAGVIVNHSIVFTDFVNRMRLKGMSKRDSIVEAGKVRLRPIFLATITTVCGVLPTAYGIGGLDPFVVPLALALGWGLGIGSVLVCLFYPPLLAILDDVIGLVSWIFSLPQRWLKGSVDSESLS